MSKNTLNIKAVFAVCFLVLMVIFGGASVFSFLDDNVFSKDSSKTITQDCAVVESFSDLYPFTNQTENSEQSVKNTKNNLKIFLNYWDIMHHITTVIESYTTKANPLLSVTQSVVYKIDGLTQNEVFANGNNPFVKISNGYFAYIFPYSHSQDSWDSILDFSSWLKSKDIQFMTVLPASKSDDSITVFPKGVPHGYSQMEKEYLDFHKINGLEYLQAKEVLLSNNDDFYSWFYKTDHHWNVHSGLLVASAIAEKLAKDFELPADVDVLNKDNFKLVSYPCSFLGSMGKKVGSSVKEDMEVYYPIGDTCFHIQIPSKGIDREGKLENTLIVQSSLLDDTSYSAFLYGNQPLIRIENNYCNNGIRVLVLKKSNANIVCPYLACAVQYLDMIDPRLFDGSIRTFIEQTKPDIVLTCSDVISEGEENLWKLK